METIKQKISAIKRDTSSRFIYLQGLQRENVWRFGKGLKGREILRFAQYDKKRRARYMS